MARRPVRRHHKDTEALRERNRKAGIASQQPTALIRRLARMELGSEERQQLASLLVGQLTDADRQQLTDLLARQLTDEDRRQLADLLARQAASGAAA